MEVKKKQACNLIKNITVIRNTTYYELILFEPEWR